MPLDYADAIREYPPFLAATCYWTHLAAYLSLFPSNQVHVIFFEKLTADPEGVMADVFSFLELPQHTPLEIAGTKRNPRDEKVMYSPAKARLYSTLPLRAARQVPYIASMVESMLNKLYDRPLIPATLEAGMEAWIREELREEVAKLYEFVGTDEDPWNFFAHAPG